MAHFTFLNAFASRHRAAIAHSAPFALWLGVLYAGGDPLANYLLRIVLGSAALALLRPWRWYAPPRLRHIPLALGVGLGVAVLWVLPESAWVTQRWPQAAGLYLRVGVLGTPTADAAAAFSPAQGGWTAALLRLAGSVIAIGIIEECFWRGFVYRALANPKFLDQDPAGLGVGVILLGSLAFGFEHARWLVGTVAGLAYALLYMRTRDLWSAVIAHGTTNALLGIYVIRTGHYAFW